VRRAGFGLAYFELGATDVEPVVVALHGLASTGRSLRPVLGSLAERGARVLAPDLLGHGASEWPPDARYDVDDHLAALDAWAESAIGPRPVWLVGCSMGSLLALAWAARRPDRVRGVAAISAPLFASTSEARMWLGRADPLAWLMLHAPWAARVLCRTICGQRVPARRLSTARRFGPLLARVLASSYGLGSVDAVRSKDADPKDVHARLLDGLADCWLHSWPSLYGSFLHCIVERRAGPDLERLRARRMPLLFLHGDRDLTAPIGRARESAAFGGWALEEYRGGTHALVATHASAVGRRLASFIDDQPDSRRAVGHLSSGRG